MTSVILFFVGSGRRRALFSAFYCKNGKKDQLLILSFQYISAVIILENRVLLMVSPFMSTQDSNILEECSVLLKRCGNKLTLIQRKKSSQLAF